MTAKQAKELSHKHNADENDNQMMSILTQIKQTCQKGEYSVNIYTNIKSGVRSRLVEMGYKVHRTQFERDGEVMTQIDWS